MNLYSFNNCSICFEAKGLLKKKKITFQDIDLDGEGVLSELRSRNVKANAAPILEHNGVFFAGQEVIEYISKL